MRIIGRHGLLWVALACVVVCFASAPAHAEDPAHAKALYKEALVQYNLGEYEKALDKFKAAYVAVPDPAFLFNIAQCQRQLGQFEAASKSYRAFLRETHALSDAQRTEVQRLVADMDQAVREQRMKTPPTGTEPPEGATPHETQAAPQQPVATPPPASSSAAAVVATAPPPPRPWYKNGAGMALTFGGAAIAIVGAGLLGGASADDSSSRNAATLQNQQDLHSTALGFQNGGIALLCIGGAAAVTGAVVLALGARHHRSEVH